MKRIIYFFVGFVLISLTFSCKKEGRIDMIGSDVEAPLSVKNIKVKSISGSAIITYDIPAKSNIYYVKAVYEIRPGVFRSAKSSYYSDTLKLVGFGDTLNHEVKIYGVGRNEKISEPTVMQVSVLTPPVKSIFKTLKLEPTFGGVSVTFDNNETNADLSIVVIADTTGTDNLDKVGTNYTRALDGSFSVRGFDTNGRKYGVYIQDHWGNVSDTLIRFLTTYEEMKIPSNLIKVVELNGDQANSELYGTRYGAQLLFDGSLAPFSQYWNDAPNPKWFTFDLGSEVTLSRMRLWQRSEAYGNYQPEIYEIWGSDNPDPDGGWTNWRLLGHFNAYKPSGLPVGQVTPDDENYAIHEGVESVFPQPQPTVRYLRFKLIKTYGGQDLTFFMEMGFWGDIH